MIKKSKAESKKHKLDLELDRELESTFPASDALKITLRRHEESDPPETPHGNQEKKAN